jgi:hypothetical protein
VPDASSRENYHICTPRPSKAIAVVSDGVVGIMGSFVLAMLLLLPHSGAPLDGKTCYGSLQIGDILGSKPWTVHDINLVKRGSQIVAWVYEDENRFFWIEQNVRANFPRFAGNEPPRLPLGTLYARCWADGAQFKSN